jgi:hypothetical protein
VSDRLRSLYLWRVTNYAVLVLECALLALEVFRWHSLFGIIPNATGTGVMLFAVWRNARRIASARQDLRRPDYSRIATLEREIYGKSFRHDGAPAAADLHIASDEHLEFVPLRASVDGFCVCVSCGAKITASHDCRYDRCAQCAGGARSLKVAACDNCGRTGWHHCTG